MPTPIARRARLLAVGAAAALVTLAACETREDPTVAILTAPGASGGLTLTPGSATLAVGGTAQLFVTAAAALRPVFFRSENPGIATVSSSGVVTAAAVGTAVITAISSVDTTRRATASVRVTGPTAP
jgi:uncharacterized protein YjdB